MAENMYGDIEIVLACRTCVLGGKGGGKIVVGVTKNLEIQVFCKDHGNVSTFKMDGRDLGVVAEVLKTGCESCRTGKPHTH